MVLGITHQDLQEEFQTLRNSLQLELQVEFVKLNKRLDSLERLSTASRTSHLQPHGPQISSEQPLALKSVPSKQFACQSSQGSPWSPRFSNGNSPRMSDKTTDSRRPSHTSMRPSHRGISAETALSDHVFRSFAAGVEARHWHEDESMSTGDQATGHGGKLFFHANTRRTRTIEILNHKDHTEPSKQVAEMGRVKKLVLSPVFNGMITTLIFLNAVTLGVQTDHMARLKLQEVPIAFKAIELSFCGIFTLEILLKLVAHRETFFTAGSWKWNVFDCFLVAMTIIEELLDAMAPPSSNFSAMRILRILRVVRIVRVIRLLRVLSELRAIVASVLGSLKSLLWTILLLLCIMYLIGVYFTQLLIDERISGRTDLTAYTRYYGSLAQSILTLYESISGGIDWDVAVSPLINDISPFHGLIFGLYIAFGVLAVMNIVTGVFVESALQSVEEDKNIFIVNRVHGLVEEMKEEGDGVITWQAFLGKLASNEMCEVFKHIDVDLYEAPGVFMLLDLHDEGVVDPDEFLNGILKLGGTAKALELALMMRETKRLTSKVQQILGLLEPSTMDESKPQPPLRQAARDPPPEQDLKCLQPGFVTEIEYS